MQNYLPPQTDWTDYRSINMSYRYMNAFQLLGWTVSVINVNNSLPERWNWLRTFENYLFTLHLFTAAFSHSSFINNSSNVIYSYETLLQQNEVVQP